MRSLVGVWPLWKGTSAARSYRPAEWHLWGFLGRWMRLSGVDIWGGGCERSRKGFLWAGPLLKQGPNAPRRRAGTLGALSTVFPGRPPRETGTLSCGLGDGRVHLREVGTPDAVFREGLEVVEVLVWLQG